MINKKFIENNIDQGIAAYVDFLNYIRIKDLIDSIELILTTETNKLADLSFKTTKALEILNIAELEINNLIDINRGNKFGLHGFIAEFAEVGVRNARYAYEGIKNSVILLNNNGPADILLNEQEIQMKFYENILNGLNQSKKYHSMKMMYPKDHVKIIDKIMSGEEIIKFDGNKLSNNQITKIKNLINEESIVRNKPYKEWIESSIFDYSEVQRDDIGKTLVNEIKDINKKKINEKQNIKKEANKKKIEVLQASRPTFTEASKVAGIGSALQGGLNLGVFVYKKSKEGINVWEFTEEDWKESGQIFAKGALKGGISGYSIYGLTNVCKLAAPSAGAIVTGAFGLSDAVIKYRTNEIDTDNFFELVTLNTIDVTGAAIGAAIGQAIIPFPILGALIGSITVSSAFSIGKDILNKQEIEIIENYKSKMDSYIETLDNEYQNQLTDLLNQYKELGMLQDYSFDYEINIRLRFITSVIIARKVNVPENQILTDEHKIDEYFLS